ncbi:MAG: hypothetical protein IV100_17250 [Myxococcales bacterium]|nr:hypothetical protein [Myxococcales bacterium]
MTATFQPATRHYAEGVVELFARAAKEGWDSDSLDGLREQLAGQWYDLDVDGKWVAEELPKDLYWLGESRSAVESSPSSPDIDELSYALRDQDGRSLRALAQALEEPLGRSLTAYLVGRAWTFLCGHSVALPFLRAAMSSPESHQDFYLSYFTALVHAGALDEARREVGTLSDNTSPDRRVVVLSFKVLDEASRGLSPLHILAAAIELENAIALATQHGRYPGALFRGCRALSVVYRRLGDVDSSRKWALAARRVIPDALARPPVPRKTDSTAANDSVNEELRAVFEDDFVTSSSFAAAA